MGNVSTRSRLSGLTMQNTKAFDLTGRIKLCKVLYVHDGDSMTIAFIHRSHKWKLGVKLYGVNAPELYPEPTAENRTMIITKAARARDALREKVHNKYDFVEQDASGEWYYNTDFLFSADAGDGIPKDKMFLMNQTVGDLRNVRK